MPHKLIEDLAAALIELVPFPSVVVDGERTICLANSAAVACLARSDGFEQRDGRLRLCSAEIDVLLCRILSGLSEKRSAEVLLLQGQASKSDWVVCVRHLHPCKGASELRLISWVDAADRPQLRPKLLQQLYGLSQAEANVAVSLASGRGMASTALELGIQPQTARCHLKSTFRKMSIHRQQELVRTATMLSLLC